jgi:hypothetical protein
LLYNCDTLAILQATYGFLLAWGLGVLEFHIFGFFAFWNFHMGCGHF